MGTGAVSDIVVTINGCGLWLFDDANGWTQLTPSNPTSFAIGA
jgi:hypothetical protein